MRLTQWHIFWIVLHIGIVVSRIALAVKRGASSPFLPHLGEQKYISGMSLHMIVYENVDENQESQPEKQVFSIYHWSNTITAGLTQLPSDIILIWIPFDNIICLQTGTNHLIHLEVHKLFQYEVNIFMIYMLQGQPLPYHCLFSNPSLRER